MHVAWSIILGAADSTENLQRLSQIFPLLQDFEALDFSPLHKAVLGFLHTDIGLLLAQNQFCADIELRDVWGRTPLHWAAETGNLHAVRELLLHKADVTKADFTVAETALHKAIKRGHLECAECILMAKADYNARDRRGKKPIHCARSLPVLKLPTNHGASPGGAAELDYDRLSPMDWFAIDNRVGCGRHLMALGVGLNAPDWQGNTTPFAAITWLAYEFVEMLLGEARDRVDWHHANHMGQTVLHWTARFGDARLVAVLKTGADCLRGAPLAERRDAAGRTAEEVCAQRVNPPDGLEVEFAGLIEAIQCHNTSEV